MTKRIFLLALALLTLAACRNDELISESETEITGGKTENGNISGLYVLNEGNMGSNKATLIFLTSLLKLARRSTTAMFTPLPTPTR